MKNDMKKIKYFLFTLIATCVFAGCSDDPTYTRGESEAEGCYGVYFPSQDNADDLELDPADPTTLTFTAMRSNDTDAITVPVVVTGSEDQIFSVSEISFDDGAIETTFQVSFPNAEIGTTYSCNIQISDKQYAFLYGERASGVSFSVTRVKWNLVTGAGGETKGKWRDDILSSAYGIPNRFAEGEIEIYERDDTPGYYRISNVYSAEYLATFLNLTPSDVAGNRSDVITYIDATNPERVWLPEQSTGVFLNSNDGIISYASQVSENGFANGNGYGTNVNGVITFPARSVLIMLGTDGWYVGNGSGMQRIMLPGAQEYDYSLVMESGEPADGKVEIAAVLGADVAKVKYAFFEGSFGDAIARANSAGIDAGTVPSQQISASGTITAQLEETGKYTIVANTYNAQDELQGYEFLAFGYVKAGDEQPVIMSVRTELTWEYEAQGHTPENSIRGIMFGEDIESGYAGIFKLSDIQGTSSEDLIEVAKTSGKAFTADEIDMINDTGLSLLYTGLNAGTDYVLLVLANNGYHSKLIHSMIATQGMPDPLQIRYTADDIANGLTKAGYCKTWDFYAVDAYDDSGNTARQRIGQVVIEDGGATSGYAAFDDVFDNYVKATGLTGVTQLFAGGSDTQYMAWSEGVLYVLAPQLIGNLTLQGTDFFVNVGYTAENDDGVYSGRGLLLGAEVAEGLVAFVPNPNLIASNNLTFTGMWFGIYSDYDPQANRFTGSAGGIVHFQWLLLADPALYPASRMAAVNRSLSVHPKNYVELQGPELAKVLLEDLHRRPANRGENFRIVEMPALGAAKAQVEFRQGVAAPGSEIIRKTGTKINK